MTWRDEITIIRGSILDIGSAVERLEAEVQRLSVQQQPPPPSGWPELPFEIAKPGSTGRSVDVIEGEELDIAIINAPGEVTSDRIYRNCRFVQTFGNEAFSILHWKDAPVVTHPKVYRNEFWDCEFVPHKGYGFYCDGDFEDVLMVRPIIRSSTMQSPFRGYNLRRFAMIDPIVENVGDWEPDDIKAAARFINSDMVAVIGGVVRGGGIWINQPKRGGGWYGRHWLSGIQFEHWSTGHAPVCVWENQAELPEGIRSWVTMSRCRGTSNTSKKFRGGNDWGKLTVDGTGTRLDEAWRPDKQPARRADG